MSETLSDFLEHYGIKGMRWGVRRKRGSDGRVEGSGDSSKSGDSKPETSKSSGSSGGSTSSSKTNELTTQQLQEAVNRMNLENQYSRLSSERAAKSKTLGQKLIDEGVVIAQNVARQQITNAANKVVGKAIDDKLLEKGLINPPKKKKK